MAADPVTLLELNDPHRGRLVVGTGQTVVLLGPSGAGKTRLIRSLLGLDGDAPEPVLWLRGRPARAREVAALAGWVPEGDGVFLSDSVWDNVAHPPGVEPRPKDLAHDALVVHEPGAPGIDEVGHLLSAAAGARPQRRSRWRRG